MIVTKFNLFLTSGIQVLLSKCTKQSGPVGVAFPISKERTENNKSNPKGLMFMTF